MLVITVHEFGSWCLGKASAYQQPWRNQADVKVMGPCAVWEPGGDVLSEGLPQVWWKIKRAVVLWVITLPLRLVPAEWNVYFMWFLMLLSFDQPLSELSFILTDLACPRANWGLLAFSKLEFSIYAFSCAYA